MLRDIRDVFLVKVLLILGSGSKRVMAYFISGGGAIAIPGTIIGSVSGCFFSKNVFGKVFESAQSNVYDNRFSIGSYGIKSERFIARPEVNFGIYALIGVAVILLALTFCAFFAFRVIRNQNPRYRSTEILITVVDKIERPKQREKVQLLARNAPAQENCDECGAPAAYANAWGNELLCDEFAKNVEDEATLLPIVNSPRHGECGYTGELDIWTFDLGKPFPQPLRTKK